MLPGKPTGKALFQSTLPVWGATNDYGLEASPTVISIHAPRVGSDKSQLGGDCGQGISIHAPRVGSDPSNRITA